VVAVASDAAEVTHKLCAYIEQRFKARAADSGRKFVIGLSGGSLPKFLAAGAPDMHVDWSQVTFIFCDERCVPFADSESTFGVYKDQWVGKVKGVTEDNFVTINPELNAEEAAK